MDLNNSKIPKKTGYKGGGGRWGIEKPTIAGPGRPRLPDSVKERRAILRRQLEEIVPDALRVVHEVLNDPTSEKRDKLRAAEISLQHSLPKQEEVTIEDERPLAHIPTEQLEAKLAELDASTQGDTPRIGIAS